MSVDTVRMSSKGQIVIPSGIREELGAGEGTLFAVIGTKDAIVLKKVQYPSQEELINDLALIARDGKRRLEKKGVKEKDLQGGR